MKQSGNVLSGASIGIHLNEVLTATKACIGSLTQKISEATTRIMLAMRIGRMASALTAYSDEQLEHIGVLRKDIRDHARMLITYEYDGL